LAGVSAAKKSPIVEAFAPANKTTRGFAMLTPIEVYRLPMSLVLDGQRLGLGENI